MPTDQQRADFDRDGIVRIPAAFTADDAERMLDVIWGELRQRYGIDRDDRATWDLHPPSGFRTAKKHRAFAPIFGAPLVDALDDLLGAGEWLRPKHYGQVLVTMPNATEWRVPHWLWHNDFQYDAGGLFAVKYWVMVDVVEPGGGGTPQLAGSHRLMERYVASSDDVEYKRVRDTFMQSHPWLAALADANDPDPSRNRRCFDGTTIEGVEVRVVELTGAPGDLYLTHPWVSHAIAPNASSRPRVMRSMAIWRRGCGPGAASQTNESPRSA